MPVGMPAWQMPQGGIDPGESPAEAAFRELAEETGTDKAEIVAESGDWHCYDIPAEIGPMITDERLRRVWTILIGLTAMAITVGLATIVVHDRIH